MLINVLTSHYVNALVWFLVIHNKDIRVARNKKHFPAGENPYQYFCQINLTGLYVLVDC